MSQTKAISTSCEAVCCHTPQKKKCKIVKAESMTPQDSINQVLPI